MKKLSTLMLALSVSYAYAQETNPGNGKEVIIKAGKEVVLDKDVYDYSTKMLIIEQGVIFVANDTVKDGHPRTVTFKAESIVFKGRVVFNGKGEKGRDGHNGDNCASCNKTNKGVVTYDNEQKYDSACKAMAHDVAASGKEGENGERGVQGTKIVFEYTKDLTGYDIYKIMNNLSGGEGGEGGKGGVNKQVIFQNGANHKECTALPHKQKDGAKGGPGDNGVIVTAKH